MIRKFRRIIFLQCILICFLYLSQCIAAHASSADITISSDKKEYWAGDVVEVYIDIEAELLPGDFEAYLLYPSDLLKYVSGPEIAENGDGEVFISDTVSEPSRNSRRYSLKFKARASGTAQLSLKDSPELYEYEEGYLVSVSVNEYSITILGASQNEDKPTATPKPVDKGSEDKQGSGSGNGSGSDGITNSDGKSGSGSCTESGNGNGTGSDGNMNPSNTDSNGKSGSGSGTGNGTDNEPVTNSDSTEKGDKKKLSATADGGRIYLNADNTFEITDSGEDLSNLEIPEGYRKTSMVIDGLKIPVYAKDDTDAFMLIPVKDGEETVLYSYDRKEKTLQRYNPESRETVVKNIMTDSIEALELANSYEKSLNTMTLIIAVLGGLAMSLLIIVIRMALKNRGDGSDF